MSSHYPVAYRVVPEGYATAVNADRDMWAIAVELTDEVRSRWAIRSRGRCLSVDGRWDYENIPSERTDEWLDTHRFPLELALAKASEAVEHSVINGMTLVEASARVAARLARQEADRG